MTFPPELHDGVQRIEGLQLDLAPACPGIYAWYARLPLAPSDWKPAPNKNGVDMAGGYFIRAIRDYAAVHREQDVTLQGTGSYGVRWTGLLTRDSISDEAQQDNDVLTQRMGDALNDPEIRRALIALLGASVPAFASPLYIGVATDLQVRLQQHKADFESAMQVIRNNPLTAKSFYADGSKFGERLAGAGLALDEVVCFVLPVDVGGESGLSHQEQRKLAGKAEWILQRIFQPVLGRK